MRKSWSKRIFLLSPLLLFLTACGGRAINKRIAQDIIAGDGFFNKGQIQVDSVTQTGSGEAVVQADVLAAFRLEKVHGIWRIREIRLGNGQWEKFDDVLGALNAIKIEETKRMLEAVAGAIDRYRANNGRLPEFTDYVSLSDALSPGFLDPLVRLDAWRNPLAAFAQSPGRIEIVSAGPDGTMGTSDDIKVTRSYDR
jgi:hypothetical protein